MAIYLISKGLKSCPDCDEHLGYKEFDNNRDADAYCDKLSLDKPIASNEEYFATLLVPLVIISENET